MLRAIIIDDEILAIHLLKHLILETGEVHVVGSYTSVDEGIAGVMEWKPDIIFLDIEMPSGNGIKAAEMIQQRMHDYPADIVFVTAYDHYALDAFNVHAVDYLLKPVAKERLHITINRILQRRKRVYTTEAPAQEMKAYFMGQFSLLDPQGQPIKWRTKKVKELCAYLLHHRVPVHRTSIIEDLWSHLPLEKASSHLHTSIYQLRKEFKSRGFADPILYVNECYSLNLAVSRDVDKINEMINQSSHSHQVEPNLLDLYTQDYLDAEDYSWTVEERKKIRKAFISFLEERIHPNSAINTNIPIVKDSLEQLIRMEPFEERYIRELITYYVQLGNIKKAMDIYHTFETFLREELGERPQLETEKLIRTF